MDFYTAVDMVKENGAAMLADPKAGINAVAVGRKDAGPLAGATDYCVTAFVRRKRPLSQLADVDLVPFDRVFSASTGVKETTKTDMDVVETGTDFMPLPGLRAPVAQRGLHGGNPPALNAQKWFSTLRCGIGITNPANDYPNRLSVGTAGFYLRDDDGHAYMVSNNHVIGRSNDAQQGDPVVQPGTLDLTGAELRMMPDLPTLERGVKVAEVSAVVMLAFQTALNIPVNVADAALARLDDSDRGQEELARLTFGGHIRGIAAPYMVDEDQAIVGSSRVYKVGRTTGYTEGDVTNVAGVTNIPYPGGTAHFANQLFVRPTLDNVGPFSAPGDSGSGVLNDGHELVGLLFAGSASHTIINPIAEVLDALRAAAGNNTLEVITG